MPGRNAPTLPFPEVVPFPADCPGCGYDLRGSEGLGRCPECGAPAAFGVPCLALACVPRRPPGPRWRRVAWVVLLSGFVLLSQAWVLLAMHAPWMLGMALLTLLAAAGGMVATGTPVSKATERVVFSPAGIARGVWGKPPTSLHRWEGGERCETRRIGAVWQRLTVRNARGEAVIDTGFRCRDADLPLIASCVEAYARGTLPDEVTLARIGPARDAAGPTDGGPRPAP